MVKSLALLALVLTALVGCFEKKGVSPAQTGGTGGKVVLGVPNWPSALAKSNIFKAILEDNFGLEVELQTGSNAVIYEAMDKGAMHLHPEGWAPNHNNFFKKYVTGSGTVKASGAQPAKAGQGICTTEGTAKRTGLAKVTDLTKPEVAKKFDSDGDGKGEMWIGASGWGSTPTERIRAKSYGYSSTMKLKVMEEAMAIAELDAAVTKKKNIVFFCYFPHYTFVLYKLRVLEEPPHDPAKWKILKPDEDPAWLEKSYASVAWPEADMNVYYSKSLEQSHPAVAKIFSKANFSSEDTSKMSFELSVNKVEPEKFARQWIEKNASVVNSWLQ